MPNALHVPSRIAVGTMNFGKRTPVAESERIILHALERGLTFFDTANVYNDGESERILGRAIAKRRGDCTVASKAGLARVSGKVEGLSRAAILRAIDATLSRLGTDYVDVYYLHAPDHATPIEETIDAMGELLQAKKVRAWGVSNYASWQILEMMILADAKKIPRPAVSQVIHNLLIRQIEVEYLAFAARHGIHTTIYNPLAGGLLTGRYARGDAAGKGTRFDGNALYLRRYWSDRMFDLAESMIRIGREEGLSAVELAYAWAFGRPGVDSVLIGPASAEHLDAAISASEKSVSDDAQRRIDAAYRAWLGTDTNYVR